MSSNKNWLSRKISRMGQLLLRPIYKVYEKWLWLQIKNGPFPIHIGIIPDGNRRWARKMKLNTWMGHEAGYERIKEVLSWIWDLGIEAVTIYAMSTENCTKRPPEEREKLFEIARRGLKELLTNPDIHKYKVKVRVIGNKDLIPQDVLEMARKVEEETVKYNGKVLNIALCYGGRQEIIAAVKKLAEDVKKGSITPEDIDEKLFSKYLYTKDLPDPDLIIRTSGEVRISNFLLWQLAYSELYFCEAYWPEFRKIDFWRAIRSYQHRERRFGR
ncbi:MAG: di-trans,poly-cis-decaprenylcistransferase [Desulfurococcales archaeon]|nr:di-trans,poly-cis-decaprenylcistransferase [Desulfurococcales archaeon]